jgi:phosphoenolpyruvate carboxylase
VAVDIAPLFDSIEVLERCGEVMRTLLGDPLYRRHLEARGRTQCALVGYSDANKEGGIVASRHAAYRAQAELSAALAAANERQVLFHARGGSIARGGGRVDSLVRSAPPGTVNGVLRLTEQGEGINQGDWPGREHALSAREAEVLALIAQGLSNQEIADRAFLSINSVKTYIRSAYRKIGVERRTQAVLWATQNGFVPTRSRRILGDP